MPLYEFRCGACGHELEVLQKLSDPNPVDCPSCHQPALQKKLTAAGFQLKGTGWYATDFKGGNRPPVPVDEAAKPAGEAAAPVAGAAAAPVAGVAAATGGATPASAPAAAPAAGGTTPATPAG